MVHDRKYPKPLLLASVLTSGITAQRLTGSQQAPPLAAYPAENLWRKFTSASRHRNTWPNPSLLASVCGTGHPWNPSPFSHANGPPSLSLTNALCPLTYSTQMSKHALAHRMSLLPLNGFYFSNHVLKLNHQIVGMNCACVSHHARTHSAENKSGQESSQVCTKNKLDN